MTRKEALTDLLAKVEAGETPEAHEITTALRPIYDGDEPVVAYFRMICDPQDIRAMGAAKALHEAVLPGWVSRHHQSAPDRWHFYVAVHVADRWVQYGRHEHRGIGSPARAWLIAIIKALIAKEDT